MQPGTHLGPYEILSRIGAGGMGEVFRARDTRLGRDVAIKILPAEFAHDAKLKIRFEREAKTVSQLSHPNICTLRRIGEDCGDSRRLLYSDGRRILMMDRVTAETREVVDLGAPFDRFLTVTKDGRSVYYVRNVEESDIWVAKLENP